MSQYYVSRKASKDTNQQAISEQAASIVSPLHSLKYNAPSTDIIVE